MQYDTTFSKLDEELKTRLNFIIEDFKYRIDSKKHKLSNIKGFNREYKSISNDIGKYDTIIKTLVKLGNFTTTYTNTFMVSIETQKKLREILPLLDEKDKNRIASVFYEEVNERKKSDMKRLEELEKESKKNITNKENIQLISKIAHKHEQRINQEGSEKIDFLRSNYNPIEEGVLEHLNSKGNRFIYIVQKLKAAGKLDNNYIRKNMDKIAEVYNEIGKLKYLNNKLKELISQEKIANFTKNDTEFRSIINDIIKNNEKRIDKLSKIIDKVEKYDLEGKFSDYIKETGEERTKEYNLKNYRNLVSNLFEAVKTHDAELQDKLVERVKDLEDSIPIDEREKIYSEVEKKFLQEEDEIEIIGAEEETKSTSIDMQKLVDLKKQLLDKAHNIELQQMIFETNKSQQEEKSNNKEL